ncbi:MAG: glycosyltransferase family 2 protein [Alphaproteobacteria bacterium]|nr:glycosyltransferase family 2 protein [Alphaproteobacteria bacterium]
MKKNVSIVISCYNEEGNVKELHHQLADMLGKAKVDAEIIFVNDGSVDRTLLFCHELQKIDKRVKIVNFTKNFGHEAAMIAGMEYSKGDAVIFMDADLQNPVSVVGKMIEEWKKGEKIVLTRRRNYVNNNIIYKLCTKVFYFGLNMLSEVRIPKAMPDFRLIDREYVEFLKKFDERDVMFRGMLSLITDVSKVKIVEYDSPERVAGETKYKFGLRSMKLAIDSVLQFSVRPLYLVVWLAVFVGIISVGLGTYVIIERFILGNPTPGYAAIMSAITFSTAVILFALGGIGIYIGKIHLEVKKRPLYFAEYIESKSNPRKNGE